MSSVEACLLAIFMLILLVPLVFVAIYFVVEFQICRSSKFLKLKKFTCVSFFSVLAIADIIGIASLCELYRVVDPVEMELISKLAATHNKKVKMMIVDALADNEIQAYEYRKIYKEANDAGLLTFKKVCTVEVVRDKLMQDEEMVNYVELTTAKKFVLGETK